MMPSEKVLICGAGVSGSVLAFWLAKYDYEVVVIERSRARSKAGQGLDIENTALQVVKEMGILEKLQSIQTSEEGFQLVDAQSRSYASLKAGHNSPTSSMELMRGDLTEVLYEAANESSRVSYLFETTMQTLRQNSDKVFVDLENRSTNEKWTEEFDFVVGADGARSRTRHQIMGSPEKLNCLKPVGAYMAYFSIPREDQDWPDSRLCNFPGRRVVWLRPVGKDSKIVSVYLMYCNNNAPTLREANRSGDRNKQKEAFAELFAGLGWEVPRIVEGMRKTLNFYSDELAQVKLPTWSQQRVVLVGDAAWAPTPFTGQGTQLAIIGSWVLAQEMSRDRSIGAYQQYEQRMRPYVEESQKITLGSYGINFFSPNSTIGIWLLRRLVGVFAWVAGTKGAQLIPEWESTHPFDLNIHEPRSTVAS